ncbi:MAG: aromatic amino acid lyase [Elusimicrobia bacterium]|nr:aromatic amino acid lyase [Elusimicrobiota bacterium]
MKKTLNAGGHRWTIEDVRQVARGRARVALPSRGPTRRLVEAGAAYLERLWREGTPVYGVTTGFGASVDRPVPRELVLELPRQMARFHGCGLGAILDEETTLAVLTVRLVSLAKGYSGVRWSLLQRLVLMINRRLLPLIPEEGSVGASGDLTPLSYLAAALMGERQVLWRGRRVPARRALRDLGVLPMTLLPKEGLAIMNGTSVMTGIAILVYLRATHIAHLACQATALTVAALGGNPGPFDADLFRLKDHPGQTRAAARIRKMLRGVGGLSHNGRLQDPYAVRCAPHVIGVLEDALDWSRHWIEREMNGVSDNPLIDGVKKKVLHGGHFYGGHIAFAMDALKSAVAGVADLLDRQVALLVDVRTNHGLPANLTGATESRLPVNHGLKALQISCSAWTAEALGLTMPSASFSRSTECHNQDKVSLGTISARSARRVVELTEQVTVGSLLAGAQGIELRSKLSGRSIPGSLNDTLHAVRGRVPFLREDRPLDNDLHSLLSWIRALP